MLKEFLKSSPIAEDVHIDGNVILHRAKLSTDDVINIRQKGELVLENDKNCVYELEVNGLTIATGRIVKKMGDYYFKISEINKREES